MASLWDDAFRRCAIVLAGMPQTPSAPVGMGGAFQTFANAAADGSPSRRRNDSTDRCWKKTHQIAGGLAGPPLPWHVSIPVGCTQEEAYRLISARTDDRSFVVLLNEAMAVVLPGEPIPRAKADRVRMLVEKLHQG